MTGATGIVWDGALYLLADGTAENFLPLVPIGPGEPFSVVNAELIGTGILLTLLIYRDPATGDASLAGAFFSPDGLAFGEFPLLPGHRLSVQLPVFDTQTGTWFSIPSVQPVTVGPSLRIELRAVSGIYDVAILAEDYAKNFGFAFVQGVVVR